jgi:tetratricopeptide (TPR) repeat protein
MHRTKLTTFLLVCAFVGCAGIWQSASAKKKPRISASQRKKAKKIFEKAEIQYNLGKFQKAAALYSRAYEIAPLPGFLYNIAQCYRLLGKCRKATFYYMAYLRNAKNAKRELIMSLIVSCTQDVEDKGKATSAGKRPPEKTDPDLPSHTAKGSKSGAGKHAKVTFLPDNESSTSRKKKRVRSKPFYKKWWFWTVIGVSVATAAAGAAVGVVLSRPENAKTPPGTLGILDWR